MSSHTALPARLRRWTYLVHRWCGVFGCLLMALWFASGVVMLFVGYPKLSQWQRLQASPALADAPYLSPAQVMGQGDVTRLVLNAASGQPRYGLRDADGRWSTVDAVTGRIPAALDDAGALRSAHVFLPGVSAHALGAVWEDRWTHSRALDAHRPLRQVQMDDAARTLLYVSSATGAVVMQATLGERAWNFVGAWLHWLYVFKNQPVDPVWTWTVIGLSAGCVLVACSGILVGLWRWRFSRPYRSGSRSPFAAGWMRWHHLLGLSFAAVTLTWIFSGLMSMNPLGIFSASVAPDLAAYAGSTPARHLALAPQSMLRALQAQGFTAVELEWRNLDGSPYVLARDAADRSRIITQSEGQLQVAAQWPRARLESAAAHLYRAPLASSQWLTAYDSYYYRRDEQSMMGGSERRLPVLMLQFADAGRSQVYIDVATGQVELSVDRAQRVGRWLFSLLHSWDLRPMLAIAWLRQTVLVVLSAGGLLLAVSGVVIAWRRTRRSLRARRASEPA
ncbi:PepSY domain-containing protein [Herbaspirillum sp. alder98]|uniref:PepSY domain-containing protein n=1 Tax=Herbaspirillum sp. alder98 TaxID=2913096 RepID=UPI001CD8D372|nr:PepSY domain-containing protein [Herbaspirillum sp. alder98]MCA1326804.1 PepSY domain-containing protein [Herbaspirillum sp. alder98]